MNLDDLKVVWDSQDDKPMYVLDADAVNASIKGQTESVQTMTDVFDFVHIGVLLFVAIMSSIKRMVTSNHLDGLDIFTVVAMPVVAIIASVGLVRIRRKRQKQESAFPESILGDLNKAIFQIDYKRIRFQRFPYWFGCPLAIIMVLNLARTEFRFDDLTGKNAIAIGLSFVLAMAVCYVAMWWEKRSVIGSLRSSLVGVRDKLIGQE
ncbi:hypothetical protein [Crateriforma conspicua]|uniref:Uncharacterized protein n=1 Tax=Crateriforma conspicua TaxID=2527996 RepID=A0A5C6FQ17_9PLAN|nr:hypothetical protein [Crateriforma conspicua]TWU62171.1 hypothetical protein V7x_39000 [Crateriforma conspicua]